MIHPDGVGFWLAGGVAALLALVAGVVIFGRMLRSQLSGDAADGHTSAVGRAAIGRPSGRSNGNASVTAMPTGLARTLTERGAVTAQQLAMMSPAEREFFVSTVAAKLGEGSKPRLVGARGGTPSAGSQAVVTAGMSSPAADPAPTTEPLSTSALVTGPIHCPVCRTPIGQRTETPLLMSKCPGCARRVSIRVEGDRLTVTVNYGLRTPALGITPIRSS